MTYVRTFANVKPPAREDGVPFTKAFIYENSVATYTTASQIEEIEFVLADQNPDRPQKRTLTTASATIAFNGWYWIVWEDGSGARFIEDAVQRNADYSALEELVRSEFPQTWDALVSDGNIGMSTVRARIDGVKAMRLPTALAEADDTTYSKLLLAYISKACALDLIPAGLEYWMRQKVTVSTTGTNETTSYSDPISALRETARRLTAEVANMASHPDIVSVQSARANSPAVSYDGALVTSNPYEFPSGFSTDETFGNSASIV